MKNLKLISNEALITETRSLVSEERKIGIEILHRLREIQNRRLYAEMGYSSLFLFAVNELKYSPSAAYRRIESMKMLSEIPEIEEKLQAGTLTIATVSQVQSFMKAQKRENGQTFGLEEKRELLKKVEGESKRTTEKILATLYPMPLTKERERVLDSTHTEIRFAATSELMQKFEKLKNLRSHKNPNFSYVEFFDDLAEIALNQFDPERKKIRIKKGAELKQEQTQPHRSVSPVKLKINDQVVQKSVRNQIWKKYEGKCCYVSSLTGKQCEEKSFLEVDHVTPRSLGGMYTSDNLRLLCRSHNQLVAIEKLGGEKMNKFYP